MLLKLVLGEFVVKAEAGESIERDEAKLKQFIQQIPKAEHHLHFCGTLSPSTVVKIAKRNRCKVPFDDEESAKKFFTFTKLPQLTECLRLSCSTFETEEDFADAMIDLGAEAHRQNVRYFEVGDNYHFYNQFGISWDTLVNGLSKGIKEVKRRYDIQVRFIFLVVRINPPEQGVELVELASSSRKRLPIAAIGLAGPEAGNPPERFKAAYELAKEEGINRTAHAGETAGPESIWSALRNLDIQRIDHGVRAIEDRDLMSFLKDAQIPLATTPISNILLGVYPSIKEHSIKKLMDAGLMVSIDSDDPPLFNCDLIDNYFDVVKEHGMGLDEIETLTLNSWRGSFLTKLELEKYLKEFHKGVAKAKENLYGD